MFDENASSSRSQEPPAEVEDGETLVVQNADLKKEEISLRHSFQVGLYILTERGS